MENVKKMSNSAKLSHISQSEYLINKSYPEQYFCRALPNPSKSNFIPQSVLTVLS